MKGKIVLAMAALAVTVALMVYTRPERHPAPSAESARQGETPAAKRAILHDKAEAAAPIISELTNGVSGVSSTNWMAEWMKGEGPPHLTLEQADAYLEQTGRKAENLLAASDASGDRKYLREAMEKFPDDPHVALRAAFMSGPYETEEETQKARRQWLDVLKQSAPDNATADYLSASDHFRSGEKDKALEEVKAAMRKPMQDYSFDFMLNNEEAYRNAGYSEAQAKLAAASSLLLPQLAQLKGAGIGLVDLAKSYRDAGDEVSAQAALQMAANLGQRMNAANSLTLIEPLVGLAIQRRAFDAMGANTPYGDNGQTVQNQIDALGQQRAAIKELAQQESKFMPGMPERDLVSFLERQKTLGSQAAIRWAVARYGSR